MQSMELGRRINRHRYAVLSNHLVDESWYASEVLELLPRDEQQQPHQITSLLKSLVAHGGAAAAGDDYHAWAAYFAARSCYEADKSGSISWMQHECVDRTSCMLLLWRAYDRLAEWWRERDIGKAVHFNRCCVESAYKLGEPVLMAVSLQNLSRVLVCLARFQESLSVCQELERLADASPENGLVQVAHMAARAGQAFQVLDVLHCKSLLQQLLAAITKLPPPCRHRYEWYSYYVSVCSFKSKGMLEAVLILTTGGHHLPASGIQNLSIKTSIAISQGHLDDAESFAAEQLTASRTTIGWLNQRCTALRNLANITFQYHARGGDHGGDEGCLEMIESFLEEAEYLASNSLELSGATCPPRVYYAAHGQYLLSFGKPEKAAEKLETALKIFMAELDHHSFGSFSRGRISYMEHGTIMFRSMQLALFVQRQVRRAIVWAERQRARDLLYGVSSHFSDSQHYEESFSASVTAFDEDDEVAWSEVESISKLAGDDSLFLVFTEVDSTSSISYLLHNETAEARLVQGDRPIEVAAASFKRFSRDILEELHQILIDPWCEVLESIQPKRLIIVTTQAFSTIPFAALYNESKDEYLIQTYEIVNVPSLRMFKYCELRRRMLSSRRSRGKALVVGNPTRDLHAAELEAGVVHSILAATDHFEEVGLLTGGDATKEQILQQLPTSDWIHIACHAVTSQDLPFGALCTSSSSSSSENQQNRPRNLKVEISQLLRDAVKVEMQDRDNLLSFSEVDNTGARLTGSAILGLGRPLKAMCMVLSACGTGTGQACAEGVLGLPRYLHLAGVATSIASLWPVDDEATFKLMEMLYKNLEDGMDLASALQKAMVAMLKEEDEFGCPQYEVDKWAAFFISGTPFASLT